MAVGVQLAGQHSRAQESGGVDFVDPPHSYINLTHLLHRDCATATSAEAPADERDQLLSALHATQWNKSKAAEKLHWSRMKIYRKLAKYKIGEPACAAAAAGAA